MQICYVLHSGIFERCVLSYKSTFQAKSLMFHPKNLVSLEHFVEGFLIWHGDIPFSACTWFYEYGRFHVGSWRLQTFYDPAVQEIQLTNVTRWIPLEGNGFSHLWYTLCLSHRMFMFMLSKHLVDIYILLASFCFFLGNFNKDCMR